MNKNMICCKCKERPAVIFVTKMEGEKTTNEGYCIQCAMEMNIGPIKQMMDNMGITEDQIEDMTAQMEQMMETMGEEGFRSQSRPDRRSLRRACGRQHGPHASPARLPRRPARTLHAERHHPRL